MIPNYWRITYKKDPCPAYPSFGYRHAGTEVIFTGPKHYTIEPLLYDRPFFLNLFTFNDHHHYGDINIAPKL